MKTEELSKLQKELTQQILRPIQKISRVNLSKPEKLEDFYKALSLLPSGMVFGGALDEWTKKVRSAIDTERRARSEDFWKLFNEFTRTQKELGTKSREFSKSWRVGLLEVGLRPDRSEVQFSYNEETVAGWKAVTTARELKALYDAAVDRLKKNEIPTGVLIDAMRETHEFLKSKQVNKDLFNVRSVPAVDFLKELNVVLYRKSLERKVSRLKDTSKWVFLYNIDLYFSKLREVPSEKRLSLEAGSQLEISKGKGILLNGLDASQDYKIYCYFKA
jgi:hypothetical protein